MTVFTVFSGHPETQHDMPESNTLSDTCSFFSAASSSGSFNDKCEIACSFIASLHTAPRATSLRTAAHTMQAIPNKKSFDHEQPATHSISKNYLLFTTGYSPVNKKLNQLQRLNI